MTPLLELQSVTAGYGDATVPWDASIEVRQGEVVAIVGANGAGKSTLLSCIAGLLRPNAGGIRFRGAGILRRPAHLLPGDGLALVPEGGRLFPFLSVRENLQIGAYARGARPGIAAHRVVVHQQDARTLPGEGVGRPCADAVRGARHHRGLAREIHLHGAPRHQAIRPLAMRRAAPPTPVAARRPPCR